MLGRPQGGPFTLRPPCTRSTSSLRTPHSQCLQTPGLDTRGHMVFPRWSLRDFPAVSVAATPSRAHTVSSVRGLLGPDGSAPHSRSPWNSLSRANCPAACRPWRPGHSGPSPIFPWTVSWLSCTSCLFWALTPRRDMKLLSPILWGVFSLP